MSRFAFPDLVRAFRDGERFGNATMRTVEVDRLVLPTGRIVACDPGYLRSSHSREPAYSRAVPPGCYPVVLALLARDGFPADNPNREHVACAALRFKEAPVERWEMALQPDQDPGTLQPGYHFGYGVDGGAGCFLDEWATTLIPVEQPAYYEALKNQATFKDILLANRLLMPPAFGELMASRYLLGAPGERHHPARSAVLDPATGANIVCFPSGEGDGCYPSYFGLAADGSAACLVTDFGLLVRSVRGTLEIPVPLQERSELMHPGLADMGIDRVHVEWVPAEGEVVIDIGEPLYDPDVCFENRPGSPARRFASGGGTTVFHLDEPLQPTARVRIEGTLRTEAL